MKKILLILFAVLMITSCANHEYTIKYIYEQSPQDTLEYHDGIVGWKNEYASVKVKTIFLKKVNPPLPIYSITVETGSGIDEVYKGISPVKVVDFEQIN